MSTTEQPAAVEIEHRPQERRFVLSVAGEELAHLEYVVRPATADALPVWAFTHTWTEPQARGGGLAAKVTEAALEGARAAGVRVRPVCPYVVDYLEDHPEYADLTRTP